MELEQIKALRIKTTTETEGWPIIRQILQEQIDSLDTLKGIESYKQVEARRMAKSVLDNFMSTVDTIVMNITLMKATEMPDSEFLRSKM